MVGTNDPSYDEPVRFKVEIWSPDELTPLYTFDPWDDINAQPFALQRVGFRESGPGSPGSWEFGIKTTERFPFKLRNIPSGAVVRISGGKTESTSENFIVGVLDDRFYNVKRQFTNIDILYRGLGIGHVFSHSLISYKKQPDKTAINKTDAILNDPAFRIDNMAAEILNSTKILPAGNLPTIKDRGKFDDSELTGVIKETLGAIDYTGTVAGIYEIFNQSSGSATAVNGDRKMLMRYPNSEHSGHILRPWRGPEMSDSDDADYTLYYMPPLSWGDSISYDNGVAQAVKVVITNQDLASSSGEPIAENRYVMANTDLCWQIKPATTTLQELALALSKSGTGKSDIETSLGIDGLLGYITTDDGIGNGQPTSNTVATLKIPYDIITESPRIITDIKLTWKVANVDIGRKYWIILLNTGLDIDNTVFVHTDGDDLTQSSEENLRCVGIRQPGVAKNNLPNTKYWKNFAVTTKGPVPLYSFFSNTPQSIYAEDSVAQSVYTPFRPREVQINAPFIKDMRTGFQFANAYLAYASKKKVLFSDVPMLAPNKMLHTLNTVDVVLPEYDYPEEYPLRVEIVSTAMEATIDDLTNPLGTDVVRVSGVGYINHTDNMFTDMEQAGDIC